MRSTAARHWLGLLAVGTVLLSGCDDVSSGEDIRTDGPLVNQFAPMKGCQPRTNFIYFGSSLVTNESDTPYVVDAVTLDRADGITIDGAWLMPTDLNLMGSAKTRRQLLTNTGWHWRERIPLPGAEVPARSGKYDLTLRISTDRPTGRFSGMTVHYHQGTQRYVTRIDRQWVLTENRNCPRDWNTAL